MKIDPESLRSLRQKKKLSRSRLAERSGIAVRTIQRLENEPQRCKKSREDTLNRLARALDVETDVLTGESPLPEPDTASGPDPEPVQICAKVPPKIRLAYDLIRRRYGVSATEIINIAPLFFVLLAEGSFAWRRKKIEEAYEGKGRLEVIGGFWSGSLASASAVMEEGFGVEEESIGKADLFGEHLFSDTNSTFMLDLFDPSQDNPFASYLRGLKEELAVPGVVDIDNSDLSFGSPPKFPDYHICRDELEGIANGSAHAMGALETGHARLSEIPKEMIADDAGEERAKWLEGELPEIYKEILDKEGGDLLVNLVTKDPSGMLKDLLDKENSKKNTPGVENGGDG